MDFDRISLLESADKAPVEVIKSDMFMRLNNMQMTIDLLPDLARSIAVLCDHVAQPIKPTLPRVQPMTASPTRQSAIQISETFFSMAGQSRAIVHT